MAQSNDAPNSRKRKAEAHNLKEMCLTSGRRAFLTFAWAAKLLQSPKRRRMAGGDVPWGGFNWLQHSYLHQAVIGALKKPVSGSTGEAAHVNRTGQPLHGGASPAGPSRQGGSAELEEVPDVVDLTFSDASQNTVANPDCVQAVSPLVSASALRTASSQPSTRRTTASQLAALPPSSAADEEPCSARACKGRGVPSALLVARAGTPMLAALRARRVQPKPSACVAATPAGPATNMQPLTAADLGRLQRGNGWLNDEVVNFYMLLIMKREMELQLIPDAAPTAPQFAPDVPPGAGGGASMPGCVHSPTPGAGRRQRRSCSGEIEPAALGGAPFCRDEQILEAAARPAPSFEDAAAAVAAHVETVAPTAPPSPAMPRSPLQQVVSAVAAAAGTSGVAAALAAAMATTAAGLGAAVAASARRLAPRRRRLESSLAIAATAEAVDLSAQGNACAAPDSVLPSPASGLASCLGAGDQVAIASPAGPRRRATVYAFNSFFFSKLTRKGNPKCFEYDEVRRWTLPGRTHTADCVLTRDLLLFPINHGNSHWCLAAVWPRRRLLQYFDSLGPARGTSDWVLDTLQRWVLTDAEDKRVTLGSDTAVATVVAARSVIRAVPDSWRREAVELRIPQQLDGCSCGVFVCAFAELLARGVPPHAFGFSQVDVPAIRRGMAEQILRGSL